MRPRKNNRSSSRVRNCLTADQCPGGDFNFRLDCSNIYKCIILHPQGVGGGSGGRGIYDHEVFMECEALKEAANSLATHDNLLYYTCEVVLSTE